MEAGDGGGGEVAEGRQGVECCFDCGREVEEVYGALELTCVCMCRAMTGIMVNSTATASSAHYIRCLGEDPFRVFERNSSSMSYI